MFVPDGVDNEGKPKFKLVGRVICCERCSRANVTLHKIAEGRYLCGAHRGPVRMPWGPRP